MQRSLLEQLIELTKSDYPDDWMRFCHLARVIEGESLSLDEAARRRLRVHGRYDLAAFVAKLAHELSESRALCKKFVEHFADVFRSQMGGRIKGSLETKPLEPALIRPEALRFDPDELVLDKGELTVVDVRGEPTPAPLPRPSAAPVRRPVVTQLRRGRPRYERAPITAVVEELIAGGIDPTQDDFVYRVRRTLELRGITAPADTVLTEICAPIYKREHAKIAKK
jgi:hypothetical protein